MVSNLDLTPHPNVPALWDQNLLLKLDWKRFHELTRAVIWTAGYKVKAAVIFADGAVDFIVSDNRSGQPTDIALIHCAAWNGTDVDVKHLRRFLRHLSIRHHFSRGIFITPGSFTDAARSQAEGYDIELVDGRDYLEVLDRLPEGESEYLLKVATAGEFEVPSCPVCHNKMITHDTRVPIPWRKLPDITFRNSGVISEDVCCNFLKIEAGADVQFLRLVRCNTAHIIGEANGNIACQGIVQITSGGSLSGLVAAKSLDVADGAVFDGRVTVLDDPELEPIEDVPERHVWICPAESCRSGTFRPRPEVKA